MKIITQVYSDKHTRLLERNKARLEKGQNVIKVWDIVDGKYLDDCVKVLTDGRGNVQRILKFEEDYSFEDLKPLVRYQVEAWV